MPVQNILQDNLGIVQAWFGEPVTQITLFVREYRGKPMLYDHFGTAVNPKSQRLGFDGRTGKWKVIHLTCDDDVSEETRKSLIAAGYPNISVRG